MDEHAVGVVLLDHSK